MTLAGDILGPTAIQHRLKHGPQGPTQELNPPPGTKDLYPCIRWLVLECHRLRLGVEIGVGRSYRGCGQNSSHSPKPNTLTVIQVCNNADTPPPAPKSSRGHSTLWALGTFHHICTNLAHLPSLAVMWPTIPLAWEVRHLS